MICMKKPNRHIVILILSLSFIFCCSCTRPKPEARPPVTPTPSPPAAQMRLMESACPKSRVDLASSGRSPLAGPEKPELLWSFQAAGPIHCPPSLDLDGNLYFGGYDSAFYCITPAGSLRWKLKVSEWIDSAAALSSSGDIFVGCDDGNLLAISPLGQISWKYDLRAEISSSPAITDDGLILAGSEDGNLYALRPDGGVQFQFKAGKRILVSSPLVTPRGSIIFGSEDGFVYALSPKGELLWKFRGDDEVVFNSPPVLSPGGRIHFATPSKKIITLDPNGRKVGQVSLHEEVFEPMAADLDGSLVAVALDGVLVRLGPAGEMKWKRWIGEEPSGAPALDSLGRTYVPGRKRVYCYSREGKILWTFSVPGGKISTPGVIGPGKQLYIGTENGTMICIGNKPDKK